MGDAGRSQEPQLVEDFERALREEISVSAEFDLPLTVLVAFLEDGWDPGATRRVLEVLRAADLAALPEPSELVVALPNTGSEGARVAERRVLEAVPEATVGIAGRGPDDAAGSLIQRARNAATGSKSP